MKLKLAHQTHTHTERESTVTDSVVLMTTKVDGQWHNLTLTTANPTDCHQNVHIGLLRTL